MKVIFYLKGAVRIDWRVPQPEGFNFQILCKMIRADGQFLTEGVYVQATEIAAILLDREEAVEDELPAVKHPGRVNRLVS